MLFTVVGCDKGNEFTMPIAETQWTTSFHSIVNNANYFVSATAGENNEYMLTTDVDKSSKTVSINENGAIRKYKEKNGANDTSLYIKGTFDNNSDLVTQQIAQAAYQNETAQYFDANGYFLSIVKTIGDNYAAFTELSGNSDTDKTVRSRSISFTDATASEVNVRVTDTSVIEIEVKGYAKNAAPTAKYTIVFHSFGSADTDFDIDVTKVEINKIGHLSDNGIPYFELPVGGTKPLITTVTPSYADNTTVTYSSSDEGIVTVDPTTGVVTAVGEGKTTVVATCGNETDSIYFYVKTNSAERLQAVINATDANNWSAIETYENGGTYYKTYSTVDFRNNKASMRMAEKVGGSVDTAPNLMNWDHAIRKDGDIYYICGDNGSGQLVWLEDFGLFNTAKDEFYEYTELITELESHYNKFTWFWDGSNDCLSGTDDVIGYGTFGCGLVYPKSVIDTGFNISLGTNTVKITEAKLYIEKGKIIKAYIRYKDGSNNDHNLWIASFGTTTVQLPQ